MIPLTFVQNVYEIYIKISYTFQRIPDTQSRVITKVYDFLGQPSYMAVLLCSFKDAGPERFRFKFYHNSITWKHASGMEWTIYNVL